MLPGLMGQGHFAPKAGQPLGFPGDQLGGGKALSPLGRRPPTLDGKGATLAGQPYIKGEGGRPHHPTIASSSGCLSLHHTLSGLTRSPAVFFLHHHHHAVVLLDVGGDIPHLRCPLERERKELHRHRTRDRVRKCCRIAATGTIVYTNNEINLVGFGIFEDHGAPSINFNQFLEKEKLKGNGSNFTDWFRHLGIHRVLQSPPPSYKNFVINYNMQNMNKELPELFSMLKSAEVEIKKENQVLMVNKTTSFKKQRKPNKGNFKKGGKKVATPPEKPKAGPKPETVCYYCQGKGPWKRNCTKYLADLKSGHVKKKGIFDIHVIDVYLTGSRSSAWVFDTGSVAHICNSKQELWNKRSLARDEVTMRVGNRSKVDVIAVGTLPLHLRD
ncbi:hypothetical protein QYE76_020850 [Lolium multiflorum]|uniref:Uncharacterized protein n=1 Tax=Lolium multiflorum TaxID=4521 RepID=A0AAD8VSL7_LOLMU|nr:hypothetical protein QYE76_020850 [Lolium multiflorum]